MGAPQIILIVLWSVGFGILVTQHGKPATGVKNAWSGLIAVALHCALLAWGGFFSGKACAEVIPRAAVRYQRDLIRNARLAWGIDAPVASFAAQIHQESRWNPTARSGVGAQGIAQFMPATAKWIGSAYPQLGPGDASNPVWAMRALATYDRHLYDLVGVAPKCERFAFTLSGYNGGASWVQRDRALARARGDDPALWFGHVERYNAGRSAAAWRENRGYPRRILKTLEPVYARAGWGKGMCL